MSIRIAAIEAYERALERADDQSAADIAGLLADDVVVMTNFGRGDGVDSASAILTGSRLAGLATGARWSEPTVEGERIVVTADQPAGAPVGGLEFAFWFAGDKIARVEQQMIAATPPEPTTLRLTDEIKEAVNGALDNQTPMLIAYADDREDIHVSFRGTVQSYGDEQLALWARDPEAGLPRNIAAHPRVTLFYHDPGSRTSYMFQGRARIESDPAARDTIFDNSNPREQSMDYHRRGAAIVVELDRVEGRSPSGRVLMTRETSP